MQSSTFQNSTKYLSSIGQALGLYPLSFNRQKTRVQHLDILKTIIHVLIFLYFVITLAYRNFYIMSDEAFFESMLWVLLVISRLPVVLIEMLIQVKSSEEIRTLFSIIQESDRKCQILGVKLDHKKHEIFVKIILGLYVIFMGGYWAILHFSGFVYGTLDVDSEILETCYHIDMTYSTFFCIQLIVMTFMVADRFEALNDYVG